MLAEPADAFHDLERARPGVSLRAGFEPDRDVLSLDIFPFPE
jgi:hypothetical protein